MWWATIAAALLVTAPADSTDATSYTVADGSYQATAPSAWDGVAPLPLLVVFHGYGASGAQMLANAALAALADTHGYLLVAPNGRANARGITSWSHQGSPAQDRDELAFIDAVLTDVRARFGASEALPLFTGFSQGGSMVWDLACKRGGAFGRYVAVGGAFWEPLPDGCVTPLGEFVHVHGRDDRIVPLAGRPIGGRWRQGDVAAGIERLARAAGCAAAPEPWERPAALHCRSSRACTAGLLTLCLHGGGHEFRLEPLADLLRGD